MFVQLFLLLFLVLTFTHDSWAARSALADDETYSVNCMWINREPSPDQRYIYPGDEKNVREKFLQGIEGWAEGNPRARINVWYDGEHVGGSAADNTTAIVASDLRGRLKFRDIRTLSEVRANAAIFSPRLPIYFRVDLIRAIFLYEMMKARETTAAVYADVDMKPMWEEALFTDDIVEKLKLHGLVLPKALAPSGFENGFQIVSCYNDHILAAMKKVLIDGNIYRATVALREGSYPSRGSAKTPMGGLQQVVYDSFPDMFVAYYALRDNLLLRARYQETPFPFKELELRAFDFDRRYNIHLRLNVAAPESKKYYDDFGDIRPPAVAQVTGLPPAKWKYDDGV